MDVMKAGCHSKNRLIDTRLEHLIGSKLLFSAFDWLIDPIWSVPSSDYMIGYMGSV